MWRSMHRAGTGHGVDARLKDQHARCLGASARAGAACKSIGLRTLADCAGRSGGIRLRFAQVAPGSHVAAHNDSAMVRAPKLHCHASVSARLPHWQHTAGWRAAAWQACQELAASGARTSAASRRMRSPALISAAERAGRARARALMRGRNASPAGAAGAERAERGVAGACRTAVRMVGDSTPVPCFL